VAMAAMMFTGFSCWRLYYRGTRRRG
jgi:hypothetical protein